MLDQETKRKIDSARQILVGKIPDPKAQIDQITTALIYKFMDDMDRDNEELGGKARFFAGGLKDYSWGRLLSKELSGQERLDLYVRAITALSKAQEIPEIFRRVFKDTFLPYRDPETLNLFLKEINEFTYENSENLGNAFEYLLSILGSQGDAGQFRTPRHIIDFIVEVVNPQKGDKILDPACGTAGFLISAYKHIWHQNSSNYKPEEYIPTFIETKSNDVTTIEIQKNGRYKGDLLNPDDRKKLGENIVGYDISPDMVKLSLVNLYLHGFSTPQITEYDTLTDEDRWDETFDVILANPPFMTPKGGIRPHKRFQVQANRAEVLFVDYIAEHLKIKGRAGIIVPEGIIFQSATAYKALRKMLLESNGLYAVVSLPGGVFQPYSGVKTSILFLNKELAKKTDEILFVKVENDGYDLGAQRRKIDKNDLPRAFDVLNKFEQVAQGKKEYLTHGDVKGIAHTVHKEEIAESGDYNLSGDRYKKDITIALRESFLKIETSLEPYKNLFDSFNKQAEAYRKQIEGIQKSLQPTIDWIKKDQEQISELFQNMAKPIVEMQKAWKGLDFTTFLTSVKNLQESLKKNKWEMIELEELAKEGKIEFLRGQGLSKKDIDPNGENKCIHYGEIYTLYEPIIKHVVSKTNFKGRITSCRGDVLVPATTTADAMGIAVARSLNEDGIIIGGDINIVRTNNKYLLSDYLALLISTPPLKIELANYAKGANILHLSNNDIKRLKIPLPPVTTQKQIVDEIEGYQRVIDGAKQVVENWKPSIKIDPEWEIVELGDKKFIEIIDGDRGNNYPKKEDFKRTGYCLFLNTSNVRKGEFDFSKCDFITKQKDEQLRKGKLNREDVILTTRGTLGNTAYYSIDVPFENIRINSGMVILRNNIDKVLPSFLLLFLNSKIFEDQVANFMSGSAQPQLPIRVLNKIKLSLPSIPIQKQIVEEIESEKKTIDANRDLIKRFEKKIEEKIAEVWGG